MGRNAAFPLALLGAIIAILAFFIWRKSARRSELDVFLRDHGWTSTACPITRPWGDWKMVEQRCFRGPLRRNESRPGDGVDVYLIKASRWREGTVPQTHGRVMEMHVGVYLPPTVAVKPDFPGKTTPDGGHLMTWHTQHTVALIRGHLDEAGSWIP